MSETATAKHEHDPAATVQSAPVGEAYWDIVWRQFKKKKESYYALWAMVPLFLLAIFAPAIASNQPFIFFDDGKVLFPWFRSLFHSQQPVDFLYNMALLGFIPWMILAVAMNFIMKSRGAPGRRRVSIIAAQFVAITLGLCILFLALGIQRIDPEQRVDFFFKMVLIGLIPWVISAGVTDFILKRLDFSGVRRVMIAAGQFVVITGVLCAVFMLLGIQGINLAPTNRYAQRTFVEEQFESKGQRYGYYPLINFGPNEIDTPSKFKPPGYSKAEEKAGKANWKDINDGNTHWLGTDDSGRDILVRLIYGTRISMSVGFVAVGLYVTIGIVIGAIAGFFGGTTDMLISRIIEIVMLFPSFFLILTLVALIGPSIWVIMVVIGLTGWPRIARLIRGEVLKQRRLEYVEAAKALGVSNWRIVFLHVLPNSLAPAMVAAPFGVAAAIVTEAGLSLLGFGVRPPTPSWGGVLQLASSQYQYSWLIVAPAIAMFVTLTTFNLVGSGMRDAMDPRLRI